MIGAHPERVFRVSTIGKWFFGHCMLVGINCTRFLCGVIAYYSQPIGYTPEHELYCPSLPLRALNTHN
jgi:hypothetical protein